MTSVYRRNRGAKDREGDSVSPSILDVVDIYKRVSQGSGTDQKLHVRRNLANDGGRVCLSTATAIGTPQQRVRRRYNLSCISNSKHMEECTMTPIPHHAKPCQTTQMGMKLAMLEFNSPGNFAVTGIATTNRSIVLQHGNKK